MKIAVSGKGGAGKTTLSAGLARAFAADGRRVLAVDADPNNCLGYALGLPREQVERITPLSEMRSLLAKRAGTEDGGPFFTLTPQVDDLIERYSLRSDHISLFVMGSISEGGSGCACPLNNVLRALTRQLVISPDTVLVMDMEAGIEHLGRGTARYVETMLTVAEPSANSARTALRVRSLAADLGLPEPLVVANKVRRPQDLELIREHIAPLSLIGALPYLEAVADSEAVPLDDPRFARAIAEIKAHLEQVIATKE